MYQPADGAFKRAAFPFSARRSVAGIDADHPGRDRPAFALGQQPMRQSSLFRRQGARPANTLPAPPCGPYPCLGSFADQFALELGEGGENAEDQSAFRARRVDSCALAGQHLEADAPRPSGLRQCRPDRHRPRPAGRASRHAARRRAGRRVRAASGRAGSPPRPIAGPHG